jgi:ketosteroid isomerase-like protein
MRILVLLAIAALQQPSPPQRAVEELLAADRAHAAAAANTTAISALTAMFADDVVMPVGVPKPAFAKGRAHASQALAANPANANAKVDWAPVRGGVSADGHHGFTIGYMTLTDSAGKVQPLKYVAYWVKRQDTWQVAVYKRSLADEPPPSRAMMEPALPPAIVPVTRDVKVIAGHKASLEAAEHAFSDEAQKIGLGAAFAKYGSQDAVNVGPRTSSAFVVGAAAIGKSVGAGSEGKPSPVAWAPDEGSIVASSGDLGVTFGYIRQLGTSADNRIPFITIWRRTAGTSSWRYVAE